MATKELLIKYNFTKQDGKETIADEEEAELHLNVREKTGFPSPMYRHRIVAEAINQYVEEAYFWTIDQLRYDWGYNKFDKITDISAAAQGSSFFGVTEQRLGMQQDKASQYLKGISEMLKALFQIVRELRIIDERLGYYDHTFHRKTEEEAVGSDITLKGVWIDQVEGGVKNAASVYGLAQTVGFSVLPDLFFRVRGKDMGMDALMNDPVRYDNKVKEIIDSIDQNMKKMEGFNEKVKEVLGRKLTQYYMWKLRTYKELKTRRLFTVKYLRQHYDTIKLYMGWIKPYLRNIKRLQMAEKHVDSQDIITAFEGAVIEIEVLSSKQQEGKAYHPCVLIQFYYRTRPALNYIQEGYQRGPTHSGKFDMVLRGYVWTDNQIKNYRNMKEEEDLDLLSSVDDSIKSALEALGDDLKEYLKEMHEDFKEDEKPVETRPTSRSALDPFLSVLGGFMDIATAFGRQGPKVPQGQADTASRKRDLEAEQDYESAKNDLKLAIWQTYKNYKKLHGMLTWG